MREADRKASRSPASDLHEFNRKALEKNMVSVRSVRGGTGDTGNSVSPSDLSKAQEKFAQKLEQRNQAPYRYRQNRQTRNSVNENDGDSSQTDLNRLSKREYSNGSPRNVSTGASKQESKIGPTATFCLIGAAIIIDVLQLLIGIIPILGQIIGMLITLITAFMFWLWFKLLGVTFSRKQSLRFMGGSIVEFIPALGMLPVWTLAVSLIISKEKLNEKLPFSLRE